MTSKPWTPARSPIMWALAVSALSLAALLLPQTPRVLAVLPLAVVLYIAWEICQQDDEPVQGGPR